MSLTLNSFSFARVLRNATTQRNVKKNHTNTFRNFQRNIRHNSSISFISKQLHVLFMIKIRNFTERDFNKNLTYKEARYTNTNISRNYDKDFKITSNEAILVILLSNLKMFLSIDITLEATIHINFSKSKNLSREICATDFHYR